MQHYYIFSENTIGCCQNWYSEDIDAPRSIYFYNEISLEKHISLIKNPLLLLINLTFVICKMFKSRADLLGLGGSTPRHQLQPQEKPPTRSENSTPSPANDPFCQQKVYFSKIFACGGLLFYPYYENVFFY